MDPRSIQKVEQKLYNHLISTGPQSMSLTGALVRKDKLNQKLSVFLNERPHLFRVDSNKIVYAVSPPTRPPTRPPTQPKTQSTTQEYVPIAAQAFFQFSEESNTAQKSNTAQGIVVQADEGNSDNEFELINTHFSDINLREDQVTDRNRNEKLYCPLFTRTVLTSDRDTGSAPSFPMYGLLGTILSGPGVLYERLYLNTNTPLSGLICGVQGSGKSHTLNCMLENYLLPGLGKLPAPPTVLVLHFDSAGGGEGTQPCESAYLGNPIYIGRPAVTKITVLVSPSNYKTMKAVYSHIPNCTVRPLFFSQGDLNVKRMMSLMAVDETEAKPLYMQVLQKLLRDMGDSFDYEVFRKRLDEQQFSPQQKSPLDMRLDLLDSFLVEQVARHLPSSEIPSFAGGLGSLKQIFGPGEVVIADLSDPFIDRAAACSIFDIIVGLLCEVTKTSGKVVVLDEAHKYLTKSHGSVPLIETLLSLVRQQRHLSLRTFISTQDPTNVPAAFLELSSFVIMHEFYSPAWFAHVKNHISFKDGAAVFEEIVKLRTGEAVVYAPRAVVEEEEGEMEKMGTAHQIVKIRSRVTADGGGSLLAIN